MMITRLEASELRAGLKQGKWEGGSLPPEIQERKKEENSTFGRAGGFVYLCQGVGNAKKPAIFTHPKKAIKSAKV